MRTVFRGEPARFVEPGSFVPRPARARSRRNEGRSPLDGLHPTHELMTRFGTSIQSAFIGTGTWIDDWARSCRIRSATHPLMRAFDIREHPLSEILRMQVSSSCRARRTRTSANTATSKARERKPGNGVVRTRLDMSPARCRRRCISPIPREINNGDQGRPRCTARKRQCLASTLF
jgi:hypothetical protein